MLRVGFIGLGLMGKPMAYNLLKAKFPVVVHNRSRGKVEELVAAGAEGAATPATLAARCDVVITCLPKPPDVEAVYLGPDGVVSRARQGQVFVDMSTIDAETHRRIGRAAAEKGAGYLDAPVSGGVGGAREGTLTIMVGGEVADLERVRPVLEAMGRTIYHVGPLGSGANAKLINNLVGAINTQAAAEGLVLGVKAGLDPELLTRIVQDSSGGSKAFGLVSATALARNFAPGFMIDLAAKDVRLAIDLGRQLGVRLSEGEAADALLQEAIDAGLGQQTSAAVIQLVERSAGVAVQRKAAPGA